MTTALGLAHGRSNWRIAVASATALFLGACGGGGSESGSGDTPLAGAPAITGVAAKGLLVGATVEVYTIDNLGLINSEGAIATGSTNNAGQFFFEERPASGDLLLRTFGGEYVDESDPEPNFDDKRRIVLGSEQGFEALLPAGQNTVAITPFAQMVLERARRESDGSPQFIEFFDALRSRTVSVFGFDPVGELPTDPIFPDPGVAQTSRRYAMALGGFANQVNATALTLGLRPNFDVVRVLQLDLLDGRLDGLDTDAVLTLDTDDGPQPLPRFDFNQQIQRFRNNNFQQYEATPLVVVDEDSLDDPVVLDNTAPTAGAFSALVPEGEQLTVAAPGLLSEASDPDGDDLTVSPSAVTPPQFGTLELGTDGGFSYQHDGSETTQDSFRYEIRDGNGGTAVGTAIINIDPVDDPATLDRNLGVVVTRGETVTITTDVLSASDVDSDPGQIIFDIDTSPNAGALQLRRFDGGESFFETVGGGASFTQQDLIDNNLRYVSDAQSPAIEDEFDFSLDAADFTFDITINPPDNTAPQVVVNNVLLVDEGETATIDTTVLSATDAEDDDSTLTFNLIATPIEGTLLLGSTELGVGNTFSQGDLQQGLLRYAHSGRESEADEFTFNVTDSVGASSGNMVFELEIRAQNDAPVVLNNNGLTVDENGSGQIVGFESGNLYAEDPDHGSSELTYTLLTIPADGTLTLLGITLQVDSTFTQEDLDEAGITYQHNGAENPSDAFRFSLKDPEQAGPDDLTFDITVNPVNDAPEVQVNNGIDVGRGGTVTVGPDALTAVDDDSPGSDIVFNVLDAGGCGSFGLGGSPGATSFTQADIDAGLVSFTEDGCNADDIVQASLEVGNQSGFFSSFGFEIRVVEFAVVAVDPAQNATAAPREGDIVITVSEPVDAETVNDASVVVRGALGGGLPARDVFASGNTIESQIDAPGVDQRPGERLWVSLTRDVRAQDGTALTPFVYEFRTAVGGTGIGTLTEKGDASNVFEPTLALAAADMDNDGDIDVISSHPDSGGGEHFHIDVNDGDGNFQPQPNIPGLFPALQVGDVNLDGTVDVVLLEDVDGALSIVVYLNDFEGNLDEDALAAFNVDPTTTAFALGDINGDGVLDIVTAQSGQNVRYTVYTGSLGTNLAYQEAPSGSGLDVGSVSPALDVQLGDIDNDGDLDGVLLVGDGGEIVELLVNDGTGLFSSTAPISSDGMAIDLADFDGNALLDVLVTGAGGDAGRVFAGDGAGGFTARPAFGGGFPAVNAAVGDLDADGDLDVVSLFADNGGASARSDVTYFNDGTGVFAFGATFNPDRSATALELIDVDGDLDLDAYVGIDVDGTGTSNPRDRVYLNNNRPVANGDAATVAEDSTSNEINLIANDTDADGDDLRILDDSVLGAEDGATVVILAGNQSINYAPPQNFSGVDTLTYIVSDGNGGQDTGTITITVNNQPDAPQVAPDQSFNVDENTPNLTPVGTVQAADPDGDDLSFFILGGNTDGAFAIDTDTGELSVNNSTALDFEENPVFSLTIQADDGGLQGTATVTININDVNEPPNAFGGNIGTTDEDTPDSRGPGSVGVNDEDEDGDALTITAVNGSAANVGVQIALPSGALLTVNADRSYSFNPNGAFETLADGESANVSFDYTISDNEFTDTASAFQRVLGVNDAPVAADDNVATDEDSVVSGDLFADNGNGVDADPDSSFVLSEVNGSPANVGATITLPSGATLLVTPDGSFDYDPNGQFDDVSQGENGGDSFTYTISDGSSADTATVSITVIGVNDPPMAMDDAATTPEDTAVNVAVLSNDSDVDNALDPGTVVVVSPPSDGSAVVESDGSITYTPALNFNGGDSFTYRVNDSTGAPSNIATVTITVDPVNDPPVAVDDTASTPEDTPVNVPVLDNDSDVDEPLNPASVVVVTPPTNGSAIVESDGSITYTPDPQFNGPDSLVYEISDGSGATDTATVRITVGAVNDPPQGQPDAFSGNEDSNIIGDVLADNGNGPDSDPENDPLSILDFTADGSPTTPTGQSIVLASGAELTIDTAGGLLLQSAGNYEALGTGDTAVISGSYTLFDGTDTDTVTFSITINGVNDAPEANDDTATTPEDTPVNVVVLSNDRDAEGALVPASVAVVSAPGNGSAVVESDGSITYTPDPDYNGGDSFQYTVDDAEGATSPPALVTITVSAVNDPPAAADDVATTDEDVAVNIDVLGNDMDVDDNIDPATVNVASAPANGAAVVESDGSITYAPDAEFSGSDSFTYTVDDDTGDTSAPATVDITVVAVDDPPEVAVNNGLSVPNNGSAVITTADLSATDIDSSNPQIIFTVVSPSACGNFVLQGITGPISSFSQTNLASGDVSFEDTACDDGDIEPAQLEVGNPGEPATAFSFEIRVFGLRVNQTFPLPNAENVAPSSPQLADFSAPLDESSVNNSHVLVRRGFAGRDALAPVIVSAPDQVSAGGDAGNPLFPGEWMHTTYTSGILSTAGAALTPFATQFRASTGGPGVGNLTELDNGSSVFEPSLTLAVGDMDGDGDLDVVTSHPDSGGGEHFHPDLNDGNGRFAPLPNIPGLFPALTLGDMDNDGDLDVVAIRDTATANWALEIYVNDGSANLTLANAIDIPAGSPDLAVGDLNNDGGLDVLLGLAQQQVVRHSVFLNAPGGGTVLTQAPADAGINFGVTADARRVRLIDVDSDGDLDGLLMVAGNVELIELLRNDGNAVFDSESAFGDTGSDFDLGDLNGDGIVDILLGNDTGGGQRPLLGDGAGAFNAGLPFGPTGTSARSVRLGDLDADGDLDALVVYADEAATSPSADRVFLNDGTAGFSELGSANSAKSAARGALLDADGDQDLDVYFANIVSGDGTSDPRDAVWLNNSAPVAVNDSASVAEDSSSNEVNLIGNDTDADGDALEILGGSVAGEEPGATVFIVGGNQAINYAPAPDFFGEDVLTYTVTDGKGGQDIGTVTITVNPRADSPVANDDPEPGLEAVYTTDEDTAINVTDPLQGVLNNDTDADGDDLMVGMADTLSDAGVPVSVANNGTFLYDLNAASGPFFQSLAAGQSATDTFDYTATDGTTTPDGAVVTLTINGLNDPPAAVDDSGNTNEDQAITVDVLSNDVDPDNGDGVDPSTVTIVQPPLNGTITNVNPASGAISYQPDPDFAGPSDTFTYTVDDNTAGASPSNEATVTITINAVNDAPTFVLDGNDETVAQDAGPQSVAGKVAAFDEGGGADEDAQTVSFVVSNDNPSLFESIGPPAIDGAGTLTYEPAAGQSGTATVTVQAMDDGGTGNGGQDTSDPQSFTITVVPANQPPQAFAPANPIQGRIGNINAFTFIAGLSVDDPPTGFENPNYQVVLEIVEGAGRLLITDPNAPALTITNNNQPAVTIEGTLADINAAFADAANVRYQPPENRSGSFTLGISIDDQDSRGALQGFDFQSLNLVIASLGDSEVALSGTVTSEFLGSRAFPVGDLDGDGFDDVAVTRLNSGVQEVIVLLGDGPAGFDVSSDALAGTPRRGIVIRGGSEGFGAAIAAADFNRDGFMDLAIGDPTADPVNPFGDPPSAVNNAGSVFVVFGDGALPDVINVDDTAARVERIDGRGDNQRIGSALATGDLNGDAFVDLLVGAPGTRFPEPVATVGAVLVFDGSSDFLEPAGQGGQQTPIGGPTANLTIFGDAAGDSFGAALAAGDVSGDGIADLVVGAPDATRLGVSQSGSSYVIFGRDEAAFGDDPRAGSLIGTPSTGYEYLGSADEFGNMGRAVTIAGDVNGDGLDDILIGEPGVQTGPMGSERNGEAHLLFGQAGILTDTNINGNLSDSDIDGIEGFVIVPPSNTGLFFADSVGGGGDINGDGLDDIVIGYPASEAAAGAPPPQDGKAYLVFGSAETRPANLDLRDLDGNNGFFIVPADIGNTDDRAGAAVSVLGDFNGDGFGDLLITAPNTDTTAASGGQAHIIHGRDFLGLPLINVGTAFDENLTAGGATFVIGGDGDDTLSSPNHNSVLLGGRGDDRLGLNLPVQRLDGGTGIDILEIDTGDGNIVLLNGQTPSRTRIKRNLEALSLQPGVTTVTVDALDVQSLTGGKNILRVDGDGSNALSTSDTWFPQGVVTINVGGTDQDYQRYTRGGATLLVDLDIDRNGITTTGEVQRASVAQNGTQVDEDANGSVISGNGRYVVFHSETSQGSLTNDTQPDPVVAQVYRKDLETGEVVMVSQQGGVAGTEPSNDGVCINYDGSQVAFYTDDDGLIGGTGQNEQLLLADLTDPQNPALTHISRGPSGSTNFGSSGCAFAAGGNHIAFGGNTSGTGIPGGGNITHIIRYTIDSGALDLVTASGNLAGTGICGNASAACRQASISADGQIVSFDAFRDRLPGDANGGRDIFRYDFATAEAELVSTGQPDTAAFASRMSADGSRFVFVGTGDITGQGADTNGNDDAFVAERIGPNSYVYARYNVNRTGDPAEAHNATLLTTDISGDGRYASFNSRQRDVDGIDSAASVRYTTFVKELPSFITAADLNQGDLLGRVFRLFRNGDGALYDSISFAESGLDARLSFFGNRLSFRARASNIVADDTNDRNDVFVLENPFFEPDLQADFDGDGLNNGIEIANLGTNPAATDTDGDGLTDGDEVTQFGFGDPQGYDVGSETDPNNPDTDGDDAGDGVEFDAVGDNSLALNGGNDIRRVTVAASGTGSGTSWTDPLSIVQVNSSTASGSTAEPIIYLFDRGVYDEPLEISSRDNLVLVGSVGPGTVTPVTRTGTTFGGERGLAGVTIDTASGILLRNARVDSTLNAGSNERGIAVSMSSSVKLKQLHISNNTAASDGGGLLIAGPSAVTLSDSLIQANTVSRPLGGQPQGGGVFVGGGSTFGDTGSIIRNNALSSGAQTPEARRGAGIFATGFNTAVSLTGTLVDNNTGATRGGGIFAGGGVNLTLTGATVSNHRLLLNTDNLLRSGAGIDIDDGVEGPLTTAATITDSFIVDNRAFNFNSQAHRGGGISVFDASLTLRNTVLAGNDLQADGEFGEALGGAVYASGGSSNTILLDGVTIAGNEVSSDFGVGRGGGLYADARNLTVRNSRLLSNAASNAGGGAYVEDGDRQNAVLTLLNNLFVGNAAALQGGGVFTEQTLTQGPAGSETRVELVANTFAWNQTPAGAAGGGGLASDPGAAANVQLFTDNILYFNNDSNAGVQESGDNYSGPVDGGGTTFDFNVVEDAQQAAIGTNDIDGDPLFQADFYLDQVSSPAVDPAGQMRTPASVGLDSGATTEAAKGNPDVPPLDIGFHHFAAAIAPANAVRGPDFVRTIEDYVFTPTGPDGPIGAGHLVAVCMGPDSTDMSPTVSGGPTVLDPIDRNGLAAQCAASNRRGVIALDRGDGRYAVRLGQNTQGPETAELLIFINDATTPIRVELTVDNTPS